MKFRKIAIALAASLLASAAFGQANNSSTFQTLGNQTVPGYVPLSVNPSSIASIPTAVAAFATGTTTSAIATLAASTTKFTYICGFHAEVGSATAAISVNITISGLQGGTFTTSANAPVTAASATAGPVLSQVFTPCLPSSAINTSIVVTAGALGAGGVNQNVNAWGYQQ
jgi:hypothetical protein